MMTSIKNQPVLPRRVGSVASYNAIAVLRNEGGR
ncbi:hypothetical protein KOR34_00780 [Posidoniimonas corsicana]|uniref:Uncharacterized protein n=1 Tax=Posidoniimonas corsicana TaxID=1938618 RepID=A0A5C5VB08_9BACT|nr:hypothetical protein KOR34_00780 [Posidoniimonas corsicana]